MPPLLSCSATLLLIGRILHGLLVESSDCKEIFNSLITAMPLVECNACVCNFSGCSNNLNIMYAGTKHALASNTGVAKVSICFRYNISTEMIKLCTKYNWYNVFKIQHLNKTVINRPNLVEFSVNLSVLNFEFCCPTS